MNRTVGDKGRSWAATGKTTSDARVRTTRNLMELPRVK